MINVTISKQDFIPSDACFNWCVEQQVVHSNNLELKLLFFPFMAFVFLLLYFEGENFEFLAKYQSFFIYMAKLFLIIFFAVYFLVIRLRLVY